MSISERLESLGLTLPEPPKAVAAYIPALVSGTLCYTSGQLPFKDGKLVAEGQVGATVEPAAAYEAAQQAALNAISVAAQAAGGLERLKRVVKVVGFVQSHPDFHGQPQVINGASELLEKVFGDNGRHARSAVGTNALPLNAAVEVEIIFEVDA
ncbi:RidA family protein [Sulfobacillus harzensis]|uniref:RidA family protein n=1 Tax=Sulfobacillus harzensis TaxID=2729629 RepID=A0A7Y0L350_9FIRM|nr:RidA family protein [Sulfobacillus harzensis]NMP22446.1 RidA family protein [Sulfobacillus harzensis]